MRKKKNLRPPMLKGTVMKILVITLGILISSFSNAQELSNEFLSKDAYSNLDILDPTVSSFQKAELLKLNGNTGTINYSIPVFGSFSKRLPIPITLDYSYNGLKTNSISSRYGLGWNLNAGAVISRIIVGIKDDEEIITYTGPDGDYDQGGDEFIITSGWFRREPQKDIGPDKFIVSGLLNFTFLFHKNKTPINNKGYKIDYVIKDTLMGRTKVFTGSFYDVYRKDFTSFVITTDQGDKYYFKKFSSVADKQDDGNFNHTMNNILHWGKVSSWHLTKIEKYATKEVITFEYMEVNNIVYHLRNQTSFRLSLTNPNDYSANPFSDFYNVSNTYLGVDRMKSQLLKRIKFQDGTIEFNYNHNREDLIGDKSLTEIVLKDTNNHILAKADLSYDYFTNNNFPDSPEYKRLKLNKLSVSDKNGQTVKEYDFTYNEAGNNPSRLSDNTDYLGYYKVIDISGTNTHASKLYFYPDLGKSAFLPFRLNNYTGFKVEVAGIDREASAQESKYGSLESVKLPTGGKINFYYELNDFMLAGNKIFGGGIRIKEQKLLDIDGQVKRDQQYKYDSTNTLSYGVLNGLPSFAMPVLMFPANREQLTADFINMATIKTNYNLANYALTGMGVVKYNKIKIFESNNGYTVNQFNRSLNGLNSEIANSSYRYIGDEYFPGFTSNTYDPTLTYTNYPYLYNYYLGDKWTLSNHSLYDNAGHLKKQTKYYYHFIPTGSIKNIVYTIFLWHGGGSPICGLYLDNKYSIYIGNKLVMRKITKEIDNSNHSFTTVEDYTYNSRNQLNASIEKSDTTDNVLKKEKFYYLHESPYFSSTIIKDNLYDLVWKKELFYGDYKNSSQEFSYDIINNRLLRRNTVTRDRNENVIKNFTYKYSANNKINDVREEKSDIFMSFIWNANNKVIAKVANAERRDVFHTSFEETGLETPNAYTGSKCASGSYTKHLTGLSNGTYILEYFVRNGETWEMKHSAIHVTTNGYTISINEPGKLIDEVRFYPQNAQMTTYTYKPLIGITSITDPRGEATLYVYDDFGRLKYIKDKDKNILKRYTYHYYNQPVTEDFNVELYTITTKTNGYGTVSVTPDQAKKGTNVSVNITPYTGYKISSITVDGLPQSINSSFTISNVQKDLTVDVQFAIKTYTVTKTIDGGTGSVSISPTTVNHGGSTTVSLYPGSGYMVDYVKVGTTTYPVSNNKATITGITSNINVHVKFKHLVTLTVNPSYLSFDFVGSPETVTVTANGSWTASASVSWITVIPSGGSGNGTFSIGVLKNNGTARRTGHVTVTNGSSSVTISVEQAAGLDGFK